METKAVVVAHWDDVVFDNRNKSYGAYQLRRHYSERLIIGLGINVAMLVALLWWSKLTLGKIIPLVEFKTERETGTVFSLPPSIERPKPPTPRVQQQVTHSANLPPLVVDEPVIDEPVVDVQPQTVDGPDTGEGFSGVADGTSNVVMEEPVVVKPPATVIIAEVMPKFGEGTEELMRYITRNVKYPRSAQRQEVEGTVFVQFVVMWDGSVQNVELVKGIHPDCDKEALRVIGSMPKWVAGSQNGSPVNVRMVLPIKFKLNM